MFSQSIDPFGFRNRPVAYHHPSGHRQSRPRPRQRQLSNENNSHHSRSSGGRTKRPSLRRTAEEEEELQRQRQSLTPLPQQHLWEERPREHVPPVVKATCPDEFRQAGGGGDDVDVLREGHDEEAELMYRRLDLLSRLDNGNDDARYRGVDGGGSYGHERTSSCPPLLTDFCCQDEEGEEYQDEELSDNDENEETRATRRRDVPHSIPIPRRNGEVKAENSPWDDQDQEQDDRDLLLSSSLERDCSSSSSFPPRTIVLRPDGRFYAMLDHRVGARARGNDSTISSLSRPGLWARTRSSGCRRRPGRDDRHHHYGHYVVDDDDSSDCCIGECNDGVSSKENTRQGRDRDSSNDLRDETDENSTDDDEEAPPHIIALEDVSDDEDEEILELASVWRNRSPSRGQWIEPDDSFQSVEYS